ncbi:MAG TPA: hypothetical protein VH723_07085 [Candidatus Limnocylindrales bacterium]
MSRLDREALIDRLSQLLPAAADPDGVSDLIGERGRINVAAGPADIGTAIDRLKPLEGYRWLGINRADLFQASPKTIGTKVGIIDESGKVLKAADLPRKK